MGFFRGTPGPLGGSSFPDAAALAQAVADSAAAQAAAELAETGAQAAQTAAEAAQALAEAAAANAAASETAAGTSAGNAATSESNAATSESNAAASAAAAAASQSGAGTSETNAGLNRGYAEEWAVKAEDSPVSVNAGGDGSTTFSAYHWAQKAAASAASAGGSGDPPIVWDITTASDIGFIMRGAASQTGDLAQFQDSASTVLAKVTSAGLLKLLRGAEIDGTTTVPALVMQLVASQTANLMTVKDSGGTAQWGIESNGRMRGWFAAGINDQTTAGNTRERVQLQDYVSEINHTANSAYSWGNSSRGALIGNHMAIFTGNDDTGWGRIVNGAYKDGTGFRFVSASLEPAKIRFEQNGVIGFHQTTATPVAGDLFTWNKERMFIGTDGGVVIGNPTGGSAGAGTLNAEAVYDDNSLLSCYPFEMKVTGSVDLDYWDATVPTRKRRVADDETDTVEVVEESAGPHQGAHDFVRRTQDPNYNPLDIDQYAKHWQDRQHLDGMPPKPFVPEGLTKAERAAEVRRATVQWPMGKWVQRLVEHIEVQAIHIETLNQRTKDQQNEINQWKLRVEALEAAV